MTDSLSLHRQTYDDAAHTAARSQIHGLRQLDQEGEVFRDSRGRIVGSRDNTHYSDADLSVSFTHRKVLHKFKTYASDKAEYVDQEFITYFTPGFQKELIIDRPVNDHDRWRFKKEYEAFKSGGALVGGAPLAELNLAEGDLKALNENGIYTVEQLASVPDEVRRFINNIVELQSVAERFLKRRESAGTDALKAQLNSQSETIEELKKALAALTEGNKKAGKKVCDED